MTEGDVIEFKILKSSNKREYRHEYQICCVILETKDESGFKYLVCYEVSKDELVQWFNTYYRTNEYDDAYKEFTIRCKNNWLREDKEFVSDKDFEKYQYRGFDHDSVFKKN